MVHKFLGNYNDFRCIADRCPDTCCSGWQIVIDDDSYERYKAEGSSLFYNALIETEEEHIFNQKDNGDCHFLMKNGLCQLICEKGEGYLCHTCDTYPRHVEEFPGIREHSLSISCPVVAKQLIVASDEDLLFSEKSDDQVEDESFEDFDEELYSILLECRKEIIDYILTDSLDMNLKKSVIIGYMRHIQNDWDCNAPINTSIAYYIDSQADSSNMANGIAASKGISISDSRDKLELFMKLEPLKVEFRDFVYEAVDWLYDIEEGQYSQLVEAFKEVFPEWMGYYKNIVLYFINSYMCGAVYDEYIYAMAVLGFYCADIIMILWIYNYSLVKTKFDLWEIMYQFSRELENSNDNMILFEQSIDEILSVNNDEI